MSNGGAPLTNMPFGRFKGTPIRELPAAYFAWLSGKLDEWRDPFRSALAAELARRNGATQPSAVNNRPTFPARRSAPRRSAPELPVSATCDICGLGPTANRPLVHANCIDDEVPF